ncbi:FAD binding domain-containing protein [Pseudonocardia xinjiangensis]|uniref:Xanthine dehydrogenase family protein subunit M n=1 Tax=Pseudonocardia xinjiangensis TaxID=75289 RepID=A0ABX1RFA4_9PSEU|nr:FAD binding domain-containing protein [Pseudonocardia xinjiangensis]NMH78094.1 xanthine dehydrogenase family protein subunit M [Pseudonocardia xinjiangensis]
MEFLAPTTWADALAAKAACPGALPVTGGTDVLVEINFDRRRPPALLDLTRVAELRDWAPDRGRIRLGAAVTYSRVIDELATALPGLAMAARTIGSPQIRNRGTVGGNLGAASPAGDSHPPLLAADAVVEVASAARGVREVPVAQFYTGVKTNALAPDELIAAVLVAPPRGPQQFCKIGTRNAMVIAVSAFGFALHPDRRAVGTGIGSAAPTPRRAEAAAEFLAGELDAAGLWESRGELPDGLAREFGHRVRAAAAPIDDVRGSAAYRLHSLSVMARRAATWAWNDYRRAA